MAQVRNYKEAGFASLFEELKWRGLISQSTDEQQLAQALDGEPLIIAVTILLLLHCILVILCSLLICVTCRLQVIILLL